MLKNVKYIKFESKTADDLEKIINEYAQNLTPINIYTNNSRHYAWFQTVLGSKKSVVRSKTTTYTNKKEKAKLTGE
jgi:hypothetical protein